MTKEHLKVIEKWMKGNGKAWLLLDGKISPFVCRMFVYFLKL
jgi:hypothetical protein